MRGQNIAAAAGTGALLLAATSVGAEVVFKPTELEAPFIEQFQDQISQSRWTVSRATKQTPVGDETFSYVGTWAVEEPEVYPGIKGDTGLVLKSKAAHHAISTLFPEPIDPKDKPLVVQYEVKLQKGLDCGGAYIKLLTEQPDEGLRAGEEYTDKTPFTIMFGPDKCGSTNKVHFIFRHRNPLTGEWEEKHLNSPPQPKITKTTALYTLIVNPDQTFEILINDESARKGSLLTDFTPSVNPPAEIDDPEDFKPESWVDIAEIDDVEATKPDDWDEDAPLMIVDETAQKPADWLENEPEYIADPEAEKPEEWDDEEDGDWVPPLVPNPKCEEASGCGPWTAPKIRNPAYKGKWTIPRIPNPDYRGPWAPRRIPNPQHYEDLHPSDFTPIGGVGIELWTMTDDILFDNLYIGHDADQAKKFAEETYHVKKPLEKESEGSAEDYDDEPEGLVDRLRLKLYEFLHLAGVNPVSALKAMPEVAAALAAAAFTLLAVLGSLLGLFSAAKQPTVVKKTTVKAAAVAPGPVTDSKIEEIETEETPVAVAGGEKDEAPVKKRTTRSSKD